MFVLKIGSTCSIQFAAMPPHKKLRTESEELRNETEELKTSIEEHKNETDESEVLHISSESESELTDFGSDWREKCKNLRTKYSYALRNNILSDVKLVVGQQSTIFHCHRLILALGSPVFEAMFYGELAETGDTVTIPDVEPEGFQHLVRFLYTDQLFLKNEVSAFKTYFAADKYCITELKKRCESFLCLCEVTPSNVWSFLENSLFLNSQAIKERCMDVLKQNLASSFEQSSFLDINLNTVETILCSDDLVISEEKILKNVIRWAEYQSQMEQADSFENILKPLLPNIRFGGLTPREFIDLRHNTRLKEVLSNQDSLAIMEHLTDPVLYALPCWCCARKPRSCEFQASKKADECVNFISKICSSSKPRKNTSKRKCERWKDSYVLSSSSSTSLSMSSSSESSDSSEKTFSDSSD